jgi:trigger factor
MQVDKKDLEKSRVELNVELTWDEFRPHLEAGAKKVSEDIKIDGFRPGNVPMDVLRRKLGDMAILEESARAAINKTIGQVFSEKLERQPVGQPQVDITKLAWDSPVGYKAVVAVLPEVELGDYKSLDIKAKEAQVEPEEVDKMLDNLRDMHTQEAAVERPIQKDDKASVDIEMFLDDVPIEGGQGKGTEVIIGQDYVVPGFDKELLGASKGDTREFTLPYPKDFHMKNLAGKNVDFRVKVGEVKERKKPELDDAFAANFGVQSLGDLKSNIRATLIQQKEQEAKQQTEREMLEVIIEQAKFGELPEILLNSEADGMMEELEQGVVQQGGNMEDYLASIGKSRDQIKLEMAPEAAKRVKTSLVVREVAVQEDIKVPKEEIDKQIEEMKKHYEQNNPEMAKQVESQEYKNYVANVLTSRKVIDALKKWNVKGAGKEEDSGSRGHDHNHDDGDSETSESSGKEKKAE